MIFINQILEADKMNFKTRDKRILLTNFKGIIYSELTSYQQLNLHGWSSQRY